MIKDRLVELGAVKFGDFTLTSGKKSSYYVDMKAPVASSPELLAELAEAISKKVSAKRVAGVELGAVPLLVAAAKELRLPYVIIRKEGREHGIKDPIVGTLNSGEEVDIIEDVVTTGGSVLRAATLLRSRGVVVKRVICVVDREEGGSENLKQNGIELIPIVRISEMMKPQSKV